MKFWLTTDTHWNHDKPTSPMLTSCGRPPNFGRIICSEWQRLVAADDLVIHLGDVIWARHSELKQILATLPGKKVLVRGNHDHGTDLWYYDQGFIFVCNRLVIGDVLLTHEPQRELPDGVRINVHGHLHNSDHHDVTLHSWHRLLALEETRYRPVEFNSFTGADR